MLTALCCVAVLLWKPCGIRFSSASNPPMLAVGEAANQVSAHQARSRADQRPNGSRSVGRLRAILPKSMRIALPSRTGTSSRGKDREKRFWSRLAGSARSLYGERKADGAGCKARLVGKPGIRSGAKLTQPAIICPIIHGIVFVEEAGGNTPGDLRVVDGL
jgi:hypothetical protein